jgi:hypothetical protein
MSQDRWQEVKSKVEGLGLKLKLHLEQENDDADADAESSANDAKAALEEMGAKLQDAIDSLGHAAKDPAIRADVKDLGVLLRDAMNETLSTVGAEVGQILKKTKGEVSGEQAASEAAESAIDDAEVAEVEEASEEE